jgi:hypothetical protein
LRHQRMQPARVGKGVRGGSGHGRCRILRTRAFLPFSARLLLRLVEVLLERVDEYRLLQW